MVARQLRHLVQGHRQAIDRVMLGPTLRPAVVVAHLNQELQHRPHHPRLRQQRIPHPQEPITHHH